MGKTRPELHQRCFLAAANASGATNVKSLEIILAFLVRDYRASA